MKNVGKPEKGLRDLIKDQVDEVAENLYEPPPPGPPIEDPLYDEVKFFSASASSLFNRLQMGVLVVVDVRSKEEFDKLHVRSAVNVDWEELQKTYPTLHEAETHVAAGFRRRRDDCIFIYDSTGSLEEPTDRIASFIAELTRDRRTRLPVAVLHGGLAEFMRRYPFSVVGEPLFVNDQFPSEIIEDFLYLGNYESAKCRAVIDRLRITHILNVTDVCDMPFKADPAIKYLQCPLDDHHTATITDHFDTALAFIRDAKDHGGRVLVHCQMGMSRSATMVLLWFLADGKSLKESYDFVKERRPCINPNTGFLAQLSKYEERLHGKTTIRFPADQPLTMHCVYEWLQPDGQWRARVVAGFVEENADK